MELIRNLRNVQPGDIILSNQPGIFVRENAPMPRRLIVRKVEMEGNSFMNIYYEEKTYNEKMMPIDIKGVFCHRINIREDSLPLGIIQIERQA